MSSSDSCGRAKEIRKSLRVVFDEISRDFDRSRSKPWNLVLVELILPAPQAWVVDWGCGNGRHTAALARMPANVVAVDFSIQLLRIARSRFLDAELDHVTHAVLADIAYAPFRDGCFDAALAAAVIHHVPTSQLRLRALEEIGRTVKEGSRVVITCWSRWQKGFVRDLVATIPRSLLRANEFGDVDICWNTFKRYYHLFTVAEMKRLLHGCRLEPLKVETIMLAAGHRPANILAVAMKPASA